MVFRFTRSQHFTTESYNLNFVWRSEFIRKNRDCSQEMTTSRISPDFSNKFHGYFQPKINASSIFGAVKIAQGMDCSALSLENQANLHLWSVQLISINMIDQLIYICEAIYVNWYVLIIHEILDTRWPTALSHEVWHRREPLGIAGALPEDALRVLGSFSGSGKSCSGGGRTLGTTGKHGNTRYRGFHKWGIPPKMDGLFHGNSYL